MSRRSVRLKARPRTAGALQVSLQRSVIAAGAPTLYPINGAKYCTPRIGIEVRGEVGGGGGGGGFQGMGQEGVKGGQGDDGQLEFGYVPQSY